MQDLFNVRREGFSSYRRGTGFVSYSLRSVRYTQPFRILHAGTHACSNAKTPFGIFCASGRIRTFVARRREIYSLLYLTALPPTHIPPFSKRNKCIMNFILLQGRAHYPQPNAIVLISHHIPIRLS